MNGTIAVRCSVQRTASHSRRSSQRSVIRAINIKDRGYGHSYIDRALARARFGRKHFGCQFETTIVADINCGAMVIIGKPNKWQVFFQGWHAEAIAVWRKALPPTMNKYASYQEKLIEIEDIVTHTVPLRVPLPNDTPMSSGTK